MSSTSNQNSELTQLVLQQKLKEYRKYKQMTQTEFAKYYGYESATATSLWESGHRDIPTIVAIDVFNWLITTLTDSHKREVVEAQLEGGVKVAEDIVLHAQLHGYKCEMLHDSVHHIIGSLRQQHAELKAQTNPKGQV